MRGRIAGVLKGKGFSMERLKNRRGIIIGIAALVVLAAAFTSIYFLAIDKPVGGEKDITVEIVHSDETVKTIEINTDAEYLRQALEEKDLIEGTESSMGLYVITVDGETTDDTQQQWWCFTQNGESMTTGVDTTPIEDGDNFEITFTVGW